ncbi:MAG: hypothetical protein ACK4SL_03420 [Candidatus Paceibacteria bacterium]
MDGVVSITPSIDVSGPITVELLTELTLRVLGAHFQGSYVDMMKDYTDFCVVRETKANQRTHLEWACALLNIKIEKDIEL